MRYLQFTFIPTPRSQTATDLLCAVLAEAGFESFQEQEDGLLDAYIPANAYDDETLRRALEDFPLPDTRLSYTRQEAEDRDWNEEWERNYFQPIVIGGRCVVHSTFHRDVPTAELDIVINPRMAFGTGHHETTGLMMAELLDMELRGKRVLDMGCGTSILAILTKMRGAQAVTAVDIDEWCVQNSLENIALNGAEGIDVRLGDTGILTELGPFDVIVANINRNILLRDMQHYVARMAPGAELLLSGFYEDDVPLIRAEAERLGLTVTAVRANRRWALVRTAR